MAPKMQLILVALASWAAAQINTTERTLLKKNDRGTLLLESCVMSSYFESTISDSQRASAEALSWGGVIFFSFFVPNG